MKKICVFYIFFFLFINSAQSNELNHWDKVAIYQEEWITGAGFDFSGLGFNMTKEVSDHFFLSTDYQLLSTDFRIFSTNITLNYHTLSIGLGNHFFVSKNTEFFSIFSGEKQKLEYRNGIQAESTRNGFNFEVGLSTLPVDSFQINPSIKISKVDEFIDKRLKISFQLNITHKLSASISLIKSELSSTDNSSSASSERINLSGIYYF